MVLIGFGVSYAVRIPNCDRLLHQQFGLYSLDPVVIAVSRCSHVVVGVAQQERVKDLRGASHRGMPSCTCSPYATVQSAPQI